MHKVLGCDSYIFFCRFFVKMNETKEMSLESSKNETVLARKLKKTLELKLENDADTVAALKELSTFFQV